MHYKKKLVYRCMLGSSETLLFSRERHALGNIVVDGFFLANIIDGYTGRAHVILSASLKGRCVQKQVLLLRKAFLCF